MLSLARLPLTACLVALGLPAQDRRVADFLPDIATVDCVGPGYLYPQNGWIVVHVEGAPAERGFQHGKLLAREIERYLATCASMRSTKAPEDGWRSWRVMADALFLRSFEPEWLDEMRGIAAGAAAGGARWQGRPLDLLDIVTLNCVIELDFLEDALPASPVEPRRDRDHCSAFAATAPATRDGKIVFGHITMWSIAQASHFRVWLDVQPDKGHRIGMQTWPGGIWSGMDYYMNSAGVLLCETTIAQTGFEPRSKPLAARARNAIQYADGIDGVVAALSAGNNGLYSNEWLIADRKTNEIAMFELGTHKSRLWRSSKDEWFGGTKGFYWGCNNAKDLDVRLEAVADPSTAQRDVTWRPSDRDRKWLELFDAADGTIDAEFGFKAFTTPPLAAARSLDAKFTTSDLLERWQTWALFGPPLGPARQPTDAERARNPFVRPVVGNDWTLLSPWADSPPMRPINDGYGRAVAATLPGAATAAPPEGSAPWTGVLLAASDADVWLAAAFAEYAATFAATQPADVDRSLFPWRSRYGIAVRRMGHNIALAEVRADLRHGDWHALAAGKGVLVLHELCALMGRDRFAAMMAAFGRDHGGKQVTTAQFVAAAEAAHGQSLAAFFERVLRDPDQPPLPAGSPWHVTSFEEEPERAVIVYGTTLEARANREAAAHLARAVAARWHNFAIDVRADAEVTDADLDRHVVLVGRPATNAVAERMLGGFRFPLTFCRASFAAPLVTYSDADTAVIAVGDHPQNPRFSVTLYAGLSAAATWHCVRVGDDALKAATDVLVWRTDG